MTDQKVMVAGCHGDLGAWRHLQHCLWWPSLWSEQRVNNKGNVSATPCRLLDLSTPDHKAIPGPRSVLYVQVTQYVSTETWSHFLAISLSNHLQSLSLQSALICHVYLIINTDIRFCAFLYRRSNNKLAPLQLFHISTFNLTWEIIDNPQHHILINFYLWHATFFFHWQKVLFWSNNIVSNIVSCRKVS